MIGSKTVDDVLAGGGSDGVSAKVRAVLPLLAKVTQQHDAVTADDLAPVLAAGVTPRAIADALNVGFLFNVITRLADSFAFHCGPQAAFDASAKRLLSHGYK